DGRSLSEKLGSRTENVLSRLGPRFETTISLRCRSRIFVRGTVPEVGQAPGRTFISYSRKDGAEFAAWLRGWLDERHLSTWQDIGALEGGGDWGRQTEARLKSK